MPHLIIILKFFIRFLVFCVNLPIVILLLICLISNYFVVCFCHFFLSLNTGISGTFIFISVLIFIYLLVLVLNLN